jgi:putative peptidoglycan lipid II flippase
MAVLRARHAVKGDGKAERRLFIALPVSFSQQSLHEELIALRPDCQSSSNAKFDTRNGTAEALVYYRHLVCCRRSGCHCCLYSMRTPDNQIATGMLSNILFSFALMGPMKHSGLALAYALASWINFALLFFFLRKKLGHVDARKILGSFFKTLLSSAAMGLAGWGLLRGETARPRCRGR